jgi:hypothetical protein
MSLIEAIANVAVGFGVAVIMQMLVFPVFGLEASLSQNLAIGCIFTTLCGAPHKTVYAESLIMRRLRRPVLGAAGFSEVLTPHNFWIGAPPSASP